ncbi:MAG: protein kinase [Candidatus Sumerlaea chitinivorans]|nr:protein kinase [Candidatus Sumerlaea chitinivorans]
MKLQCHKCGASWDAEADSTTGLVQCPECFAVAPLAAATPIQADQKGRAADSTLHEMPTVIESSSPTQATSAHELPTIEVEKSTHPGAFEKTQIVPQEPPTERSSFRGAATEDLRSPRQRAVSSSAQPTVSQEGAKESALKRQGEDSQSPWPREATITSASTIVEPPAAETTEGEIPSIAARKPSRPTGKSVAGGFRKGADLTGITLGGYEIKSKLGSGGMGTVYLARQKSLNRDVALKVLPAELAANPEFLVRFTREALSAAQLNHHNIVQVYDVGVEDETHFISMEYVRGSNLGEIVRRDGRLQVEDAVSYVLQAARALAYAHRRGFVHRDIKPENLLLNEHGLVKIADMGLAKLRGWVEGDSGGHPDRDAILMQAATDVTMPSVAMGTPAYMPPEQALDAASVDHRADQYSLGCTLYYLVAGKPPFSGTTAYEIITKQKTEPPPPIDLYVRAVPPALKKILERMLAKNPVDRYPDMDAVVHELEEFLGVETEKGVFRPRETHLAELEECQKEYYSAPAVRLRKLVLLGFWAGLPLLSLALMFLGLPRLGLFLLGSMLVAAPAHVVLDGILHRSYLFRRCRAAVFGMSWRSWIASAALLLLCGFLVWQTGFSVWLLGIVLFGFGLAAAYEFAVLRALRKQRAPILDRLRQLLKQLRLRGVSEDGLEDFVSRFAGRDWEELFEELFGYEALVRARARTSGMDSVERRRKHAVWRDPLIEWLDRLEEQRRKARELRVLAKAEQKRLRAQGVAEDEAVRRAQEAATVILTEIAQQHKTQYADPFAEERRKSRVSVTAGAFAQLYRIARGIAGVACVGLFVFPYVQAGSAATAQQTLRSLVVSAFTDPLGWTFTNWLLVCGIALLISALSARFLAPTLVTAGSVGMAGLAFAAPLVQKAVGAVSASAPQVQAYLASPQYVFLGVIGVGLVLLIGQKLLTGKL